MLDFALLSFTSLFVIVDPLGLIPTFLAMTEHNTVREKVRMAGVAALLTFVILLLSAYAGEWGFKLFGITLEALEIAGGIILLLVALDMLRAKRTAVKETDEEQKEGVQKEDVAVTPLAIPMLAGPGAITTAILLSSKASALSLQLMLGVIIAAVALLTFLILYAVSVRSTHLSATATGIMARLMGLLLATIAVQFILNGVMKVFVGGSA